MRQWLPIAIIFVLGACSTSNYSLQETYSQSYPNRKLLLEKHNDACSLPFALAVGLSAEKHSGASREELEKTARNSNSPELMSRMVTELYGTPELHERTYPFFILDNCRISEATGNPPVALKVIRPALKECEIKHADLKSLAQCIYEAILDKSNES
jgi:hypothetical protein